MAGLEEHELPEGSRSHLDQVMADIHKIRTCLPPER
jgi:hypothetical protein